MGFLKQLWCLLCRILSFLGLCHRRRCDLVSPVIGVDSAWVRPREVLVDIQFEQEIEAELRRYGGYLYRPVGEEKSTHHGGKPPKLDWREGSIGPWYGDINARMDEIGLGFHLWVGFSTRRTVKLVKKRKLPGVYFNTVYLGEGYYQGGPEGPPDPVPGPPYNLITPSVDGAVDIAVLDNGMPRNWQNDYPTLGTAVTEIGNPRFTGDPVDENGDGVLDQQAGHGLFICGLIGRRYADLDIQLRRILSATGETDDTLVCTALGETGAKVVSMSFGGYTSDGLVSQPLAAAVNLAVGRDKILVAAAGNDSSATTTPPPSHLKFWPAALPNVIAVGAFDSTASGGSMWPKTNRADIYAPGVRLRSTYVKRWKKPGGQEEYLGWAQWSGTSFAAPLVAAEIANAIRTKNPARPTSRGIADAWKAQLATLSNWPAKDTQSGKPRKFVPTPKLSDW